MLKKRIILALQFLFFLGLGVFLVWWMARGIDDKGWDQIRLSLKQANYFLLIPVFFTLLLSHYLRALRWKLLIEPLGYTPSITNVFCLVMVGYATNLAVPRFGEILKCTLLSRYERIPADKLVGTIVAERAVDVISLIITLLITVLLQIDVVGNYVLNSLNKAIQNNEGNGTNWIALLLVLTLIVLSFYFLYLLIKKFRYFKVVQKVINIFKGILLGLTSIRYVKQKKAFVAYSFFIWFLYLVSIWIGFHAMKETSLFSIKEALSILSFGSIGMLIPTQGGLGPYQFAVQETLFLYGLDRPLGYTFGWLLWLAQNSIALIVGVICLLILPIINKSKRNESNTTYSAENS